MKTKIILFMLMPLMGCDYYRNLKQNGTTDAISIIKDETDTMIAFSQFESLKLLTNSDLQTNNGIKIKFTSIKNVRLTDERHFTLNPSNRLKNQVERKSEIDSFKYAVNLFFKSSQKTYSTIGNSAVFEKLSSELEWISKLNVDGKKGLIIFSDLLQNIPNQPLNMYKAESIDLLKSDPHVFDSIYLNSYPIPNKLHGIKVYFIYRPNSIVKDQIFMLVASRLKVILENRGCKVELSGAYSSN